MIVTRKELSKRVVRADVAMDIAQQAAFDVWGIFASTNLWTVTDPPAPFGLPPGTVYLGIKIWERVAGAGSPGGIPKLVHEQPVPQGQSCFPQVVDVLARYAQAQTFEVTCNGQWQYSTYYPPGVLLSSALGQGKARQRGTFATRSGFNRLCLRVPHR